MANSYYESKIKTYANVLNERFSKMPSFTYEDTCMFVVALWQYLDVTVMDAAGDPQDDSDSICQHMDYVKKEYGEYYNIIEDIEQAYNDIVIHAYMPVCRDSIRSVMNNSKLMGLMSKLNIGSLGMFSAASLMGGD